MGKHGEIHKNLRSPLYLSGFMGAGKSTVGKILSDILKCPFFDTDSEIEKRALMTISEIFAKKGECAFRDLETSVLMNLPTFSVVALGGGVPVRFANRLILKRGLWVHLQTPFSVIQNRLQGDESRPLLKNGWNAVERLYRKRQIFYDQAHLKVHCGIDRPEAIAKKIAKLRKQAFL